MVNDDDDSSQHQVSGAIYLTNSTLSRDRRHHRVNGALYFLMSLQFGDSNL